MESNKEKIALEWWESLTPNPLLRMIEHGRLTTKYHSFNRKPSSLKPNEILEIWTQEVN